jgi:hypothetical protein
MSNEKRALARAQNVEPKSLLESLQKPIQLQKSPPIKVKKPFHTTKTKNFATIEPFMPRMQTINLDSSVLVA